MLAKYITVGAIAVFIALASRAFADNVHALDSESFDSVIGNKPTLVEFYAPWCGHCKNLAPVYEELGDAFSHKKDEVLIAKVDADEHRKLGSRYGIEGFPTLKWFPNGINSDPEDYSGGRDLESLASFVTKKSGVRSSIKKAAISQVEVVTDATFESRVTNSKKNVLVEFYAPWCGHCQNLAPTYEKVGHDFAKEKDVIIAKIDATAETASASKYGVSGYPTIKYFAADGTVVEYEGGRDEQDFIDFINKHAGTQRAAGGRLSHKAGRIAKLDLLAKKFAHASSGDKKAVSEEGIKVAGELQDKNASAKHYVRVFEKAAASPQFVASESARLAKLSNSGTLNAAKADDISIRRNILAAFVVEEVKPDKEEL